MFQLLLIIIYLSFISLGLPDGLLGAAWPIMGPELGVPISYAGILSIVISVGTIASSLMSDRLTYRWGTGKITAVSVAMTAVALLGFSFSHSFWQLCLWSIPYGFGAGSVDASLNNYVAIHYSSRHMSWLHCMWGVGAAIGPYIMGFILSGGGDWATGYLSVGMIQIVLSIGILLSLPMWKERRKSQDKLSEQKGPLTIKEILRVPGATEVMLTFFGYCSLEQTAALWASSYLVLCKGVTEERAAFFASMFYIGITVGRALNGFLTIKFSDNRLIRMGHGIIMCGILVMFLPLGEVVSLIGLVLIGLGCAPIFPCVIHSTPELFGEEKSQAIIGVQMASAYVGCCVTPAFFGIIANNINVALMPGYLLLILALMYFMYEKMLRKVKKGVDKRN